MNLRSFMAGMFFGAIVAFAIMPMTIYATEYFGKFPPTPAWQEMEVVNNATIPVQNQTWVNATSYNDKLWILTDGSIEAYFVEYP